MPFLAIYFPSWMKSEVIPGLPVQWYGIMAICAIVVSFFLYRKQIKERNFPMTDYDLSGLFICVVIALFLGARIFYAVIYHTNDLFRRQPWLLFWPFRNGKFTGLRGLSYHGGAVFLVLAVLIYAKVKRFSFRELIDMYSAAVPLGYTFGRIGNFINGELYGRVTTAPFGMIFPRASKFPASELWVQEIAEKTGVEITGEMVNLPRHPSQLYEALFEGIVLWVIIWFFRNRKPFKGFLFGLYFIGYGLFRFLIEYFREPDANLGYRFANFTTGQILCFIMVSFGIVWLIIASRLPDKKPI